MKKGRGESRQEKERKHSDGQPHARTNKVPVSHNSERPTVETMRKKLLTPRSPGASSYRRRQQYRPTSTQH